MVAPPQGLIVLRNPADRAVLARTIIRFEEVEHMRVVVVLLRVLNDLEELLVRVEDVGLGVVVVPGVLQAIDGFHQVEPILRNPLDRHALIRREE